MKIERVDLEKAERLCREYALKEHRLNRDFENFTLSRLEQMEVTNERLAKNLNRFLMTNMPEESGKEVSQRIVQAFSIVVPYELLGGFEGKMPEVSEENIVKLDEEFRRKIKLGWPVDSYAAQGMEDNPQLFGVVQNYLKYYLFSRNRIGFDIGMLTLGIQYELLSRETKRLLI